MIPPSASPTWTLTASIRQSASAAGRSAAFDNDLYIASFEAYSSWVVDWASNAPHRLFPVGHAPMRDIDETIAHVKRLAKMGFRMVQLPAFPQNPDAWKTSSEIKNLKDWPGLRRRPAIPRARCNIPSPSLTGCGKCCAMRAW